VHSAMNVPEDSSLAAIRLSLGRWTTDADIELAAAALAAAATWTELRVSIGRRPQRRSRSPRAT
jgi:cysteine sulfinate desulfinase/cysteine desulfurase-like protein